MDNKIIRQNLYKGYIYQFASYFGITSLWVMYLGQQGLSLWQIGLCESIFHIASFVFELPTGVLADRFKYKTVLVFGRLMALISAVIMLFANNFFFFAVSFIFSAWSYNMQSGTIDALMYESLDLKDRHGRYPHVVSVSNSLIEAASTIGAMLAAVFVHWHFQITYWIEIACAIIAGLAAYRMHEPIRQNDRLATEQPRIWSIIKESAKFLYQTKQLQHLMLIEAVFSSICTCYYYYFQSLMADYHFSSWLISFLMLVSAVTNIAAVQMTPYLQSRFSQKHLIFGLSTLLTLCLLLTWVNWIPTLIGLYLIVNLLAAAVEPLFSNYNNQLIPSGQRATLISTASMLFSLSMIVVFPLVGYLIQIVNFSMAFGLLGLIFCALLFWETLVTRKQAA